MRLIKEYGFLILDLIMLAFWLLVFLDVLKINLNFLAVYFAASTLFKIQNKLREKKLKEFNSTVNNSDFKNV